MAHFVFSLHFPGSGLPCGAVEAESLNLAINEVGLWLRMMGHPFGTAFYLWPQADPWSPTYATVPWGRD